MLGSQVMDSMGVLGIREASRRFSAYLQLEWLQPYSSHASSSLCLKVFLL
jgi:hypothetical protein